MKKLRSFVCFVLVLMVVFLMQSTALAGRYVDLAKLEETLKEGSNPQKDVLLMLENAWVNGYDHCNVVLTDEGNSFVIEVAVKGLVTPLTLLAASESAKDTELLMQAREALLAHCKAIIKNLQQSGVEDVHFQFVLMDDQKVLHNAYARNAEVATIFVVAGKPVRVNSRLDAWDDTFSSLNFVYTANKIATQEYADAAEPTYILNISSEKFHVPTCESVSKTKEKNRREFFGTREEVLRQGYTPCGSCNP